MTTTASCSVRCGKPELLEPSLPCLQVVKAMPHLVEFGGPGRPLWALTSALPPDDYGDEAVGAQITLAACRLPMVGWRAERGPERAGRTRGRS